MMVIELIITMYNNLKRKRIRHYLTRSDPESLATGHDKRIISALKMAFKKSKAYRKILEEKYIHPRNIKTLDEFKKQIPVISKDNFFSVFPLNEIIAEKDLPKVSSFMTSSGFSGKFAFGASLRNRAGASRFFVDTSLDLLFNTTQVKTFLINCTPMGVHVETSLPLAETSVRSDMAIAMLKNVSPLYEQTIIIGDPYFMKKLVEDGCEAGISWKQLGVSLVLGQDWFPESLRHYLASLIDIDPEKDQERMILATMGLTELGLNVFHETHETAAIRRIAQKNVHLRKQLFGSEKVACGYLFHHYPMRFFIEQHTNDSLLFTTLSKSAVIPLIRYNTGDCGNLIAYNTLAKILAEHHLEHLNPTLKLPLVTMTGRLSNHLNTQNGKIFPEDLKLGLYENWDAASQTTGYFILSADHEMPLVEIQLKQGIVPSGTLNNMYKSTFQQYVHPELKIKLYKYNDFPYAMELNYEKKFMNLH